MSEQVFYKNDIAIIAHAAVLPGAENSSSFWQNCLNEKSVFAEISDRRLKKYLTSEVKDISRDRIYSTLASEIGYDEYKSYIRKNELPAEDANRLSAYTFEAMRQLAIQLKVDFSKSRTDMILGCMNPDADHEMQIVLNSKAKYLDDLKRVVAVDRQRDELGHLLNELVADLCEDLKSSPHLFFASYLLARIGSRYGLNGEHFLVDAACASSLAAIEISIERLRLGVCDLAISGGIESNLGQGAFMVFSKVGALAQKESLPFDHRTEGLIQGEGAVLFALKRIDDAVRDGETIHGIIRAVAGSSDGRSASLFQPNAAGQKTVYEHVYGKQNRLDYLEAHGTGTPVGDQTEMESIRSFFAGQRLPVGSVKSLIGHAKGAAGGAGILKALHIIKNRVVPGSSYVKKSIFDQSADGPFINTNKIDLPQAHPLRIGVNAFGFGGTNYHLLLEQYTPEAKLLESRILPLQRVGVITSNQIPMEGFSREEFLKYEFPVRLPPNSVLAIDKTQLLALLTTWNCIKSMGTLFDCLPRDRINVVSACTLCLDQVFELTHRCVFEMIASEAEKKFKADPWVNEARKEIEAKLKSRYAPINEDAATGILNNVIAGRVANLFNLLGKTYNIDKNTASTAVGLATVYNELQIDPDQLFIFIEVSEEFDQKERKTIRSMVSTRIITSERWAAQHELRLESLLSIRSVEN